MSTGQDQPLPWRRSRQHQVITGGTADTDVLSRVIADAFNDLPQSVWMIGDPDARRQILPGYFLLLVEAALASGTVYTTTDRAGAALWMHVGPDRTSQSDDYAARLAVATGRWASRFAAFDAVLDRHHPPGRSYDLLAILAVRPDRQGQGIGSALLRAHHEVLDRGEGTLAYLDAAGPRSRRLYRRHGYLPCGLFYLPEDGPAMYPMARPPQSGAPREGTSPSTLAITQETSVPQSRSAPETTP
jgi:GNAT superfamily N-acetyltransferase